MRYIDHKWLLTAVATTAKNVLEDNILPDQSSKAAMVAMAKTVISMANDAPHIEVRKCSECENVQKMDDGRSWCTIFGNYVPDGFYCKYGADDEQGRA